MTTVYIIETMQTADGTFMGTWRVGPNNSFQDVNTARIAAQIQSNKYGTITRVSPYPLPEGYTWSPADYFYPVII
jgi:hypothetical protein